MQVHKYDKNARKQIKTIQQTHTCVTHVWVCFDLFSCIFVVFTTYLRPDLSFSYGCFEHVCQYQCIWLPAKTRLWNDLLCVEQDVKHYSITQSLTTVSMYSKNTFTSVNQYPQLQSVCLIAYPKMTSLYCSIATRHGKLHSYRDLRSQYFTRLH